jgi:exosortase
MFTMRAGKRLALALGALIIVWSYWPTLLGLGRRWADDSRYAHGFLVPIFALVLLRIRKWEEEPEEGLSPWWGVGLVALGCGFRIAGAAIYNDWLDGVSLVPLLAGMAVIWGGRPSLRWAWPSIAFLAFMIPLPYRVESACSAQLRPAASRASAYILRTCGLPALVDGNQVELIGSGNRLEVGEECSGLSMLFSLLAVATGVALVSTRRLMDKLILIASAVPIAWVVNVARITATGLVREYLDGRVSFHTIHDIAGWCAIPLAMGLLWAEVMILSWLLIDESTDPALGFWERMEPAPISAG